MIIKHFLPSFCLAFYLSAFFGCAALAQQNSIKEQIVGAWTLVSIVNDAPDGSKIEIFGSAPKGTIIFSADGHFSLFQSRAEIPKIAANDRAKVAPEEAIAIVGSLIAYYGSYSVNETDKTISVKIEGSSYANLAGGPEQKRIITSLTADELKFTNPRTPTGATLQTSWKRAKAS